MNQDCREDIKTELPRRQKRTIATMLYMKERPMHWISWQVFYEIGGGCAWRTRLSEARQFIEAEGGSLEWNRKPLESAYRYLPQKPIGPPADVVRPQTWQTDGPFTPEFKLTP